METTDSDEVFVSGHCYCGAIQFEVRMEPGRGPIFTAYCHCDSCRRAHSAPLYHVVCLDESMFRITAGYDELNEFTKPGGSICRAFCKTCGSRVLNRFPGWTPGGRVPVAFFPSLLTAADQQALPESFRPGKHNQPHESVLDEPMLRELFEQE